MPPYLYKNKTCLYKQAFPFCCCLPVSYFKRLSLYKKWHLIYAPPGKSDINSNIFSAYHAPKQPSRIACLEERKGGSLPYCAGCRYGA
ncbi:hypothetical protein HMPREF1548_04630 [Clostridium sp. KLE 1755]|nr:hypothetical protein HMPREF1548_04630 [Clostridium sp. KLE 1755]